MSPSNPWRHPFRVRRIEKPPAEGQFHLSCGRRLGYAEYGNPSGPVVLWFHGTPGGRRQFPLLGRRAAEKAGLRVVLVERPRSGLSDPHAYDAVVDWATDMCQVADVLGAERLGVVGLSGGGPYALCCGGATTFASRVAAIAVLGSVTPSVGPDATATGIIDVARRLAPILSGLRQPLAAVASGLVVPFIPLGHYAYRAFASSMPEGDQRVFADPEMEAMFIDDIVVVAKGRFQAVVDDVRLFGRDWGFRLADVKVPVRWWHGDADPFVPLDAARAAAVQLSDAELVVRHGESHLGGLATADEILGLIRGLL